jgi:hypothetical protein
MRVAFTYYYTLKGDFKLHERMISKVVKAPINLYFDITPLGRVLNKFSGDLSSLTRWGPIYGGGLARFYILL